MYIDAYDTTISGTRPGHTIIHSYLSVTYHGYKALGKIADETIERARFASNEIKAKTGLAAKKNPGSLTVWFPKPSDRIVKKYRLACAEFRGSPIAHICVTPSIDKDLINEFVGDLRLEFPPASSSSAKRPGGSSDKKSGSSSDKKSGGSSRTQPANKVFSRNTRAGDSRK